MADDKPYQSLYRKYRPQGPAEVLGQDHVIRALSGAVREGRLAERPVTVDELRQATGIALVSSARGWRPATLVP